MFRFFTLLLITIGLLLITSGFSSDDVDNYIPANNLLTEQTRLTLNAIKIAEDNEDWATYQNLRSSFIQEIKQSNPELAKSYRTIQSDMDFDNVDGELNSSYPANSSMLRDEEFPTRTIPEKWEDDVPFRTGLGFRDFSMDVSADGHIYVSVATRNTAPTTDSLIIYRSLDGGITWDYWSTRTVGDGDYNKTEVMCFDSPSGDKYVLLFYTFTSGTINQQFRVAQYDQATGSTGVSATLVDGLVLDFAVDRNYPSSNYRAIAFYDSSNSIYSIRSDPASYGTVWQDKHAIGQIGKDVDLCYGVNGSVYAVYNGFSTGNLYSRENLNYADPASWSTFTILEDGSTDTTMHAEVIATREGQSTIKVQVLYTKDENNTLNLYRAYKDDGASWSMSNAFVTFPTNTDFKYPSLYIKTWGGDKEIHCVYKRSDADQNIGYKFDDGVSALWSNTVTPNDNWATGSQKPYVAEINGEPVVVYAGWGPNTLYCDNNGWVSSITGDDPAIANEYRLSQNYPNPFNPSTTINYQIANSKPQNTTLQIYNSLGQLVRTLVNTEQSQGEYSVVWNGFDNNGAAVSSGVYYYKLTHGDFVSSRKLIKLK